MSHKNPMRRWLSFSLSSLMLLVLAVGSVSGWLASKRLHSQRQSAAVTAIVRLGGTHVRDEPAGFGPVEVVLGYTRPKKSEHSRRARESTPLSESRVCYNSGPYQLCAPRQVDLPAWLLQITGEECFRRVVSVDLAGLSVSDKELRPLADLPDIEWVNLDGTEVTDNSADYLSQLRHLQYLRLGPSHITGQIFVRLAALPELRELDVWHNELASADFANISSLKKLQRLNLCYTKVTAEEIDKLQRALPNCQIWWDGTESFRLINACSPPYDNYAPDPAALIRAVNYLRSLGEQDTTNVLREYVRTSPQTSWPGFADYDQSRLYHILPLLYDTSDPQQNIPQFSPKEAAEFTSSGLTLPTSTEWPTPNDMCIEGNIPFHCTSGLWIIRSGGNRSECGFLVDWAANNCRIRSQPLCPVDDPIRAADILYEKLNTRGENHRGEELRTFLHVQAELMLDGLYQHYSQQKFYWDKQKQAYRQRITD